MDSVLKTVIVIVLLAVTVFMAGSYIAFESTGRLRNDSYIVPDVIYRIENTFVLEGVESQPSTADVLQPIRQIRKYDEPEGSGRYYRLSKTPPGDTFIKVHTDDEVGWEYRAVANPSGSSHDPVPVSKEGASKDGEGGGMVMRLRSSGQK